MRIELNGEPVETDATTLQALLEQLGHSRDSVATALNGDFVAHTRRDEQPLREGDSVDVIAPMAGG